jgi:ADP-ribose pyrophosphatase
MGNDNGTCSTAIGVKSRRQVAGNSKFNIFLDHVVDAHGREVPDYLAVEPRRHGPDWVTGVCIVPVVENLVGLVRLCRYPLDRPSWDAPKGFIEDNESGQQGASRELAEETSLTCVPDGLKPLGMVAPEPGSSKGASRSLPRSLVPEMLNRRATISDWKRFASFHPPKSSS